MADISVRLPLDKGHSTSKGNLNNGVLSASDWRLRIDLLVFETPIDWCFDYAIFISAMDQYQILNNN